MKYVETTNLSCSDDISEYGSEGIVALCFDRCSLTFTCQTSNVIAVLDYLYHPAGYSLE